MPSMIDMARAQCKQVDLVILTLVEMLREQRVRATPGEVAGKITGAPVREVAEKMAWMQNTLQVLERDHQTYMVTSLGAEVLRAEVGEWEPSPREQRRRDYVMASAQAGRMVR